jgi:hypothetical protein
VSIHDLVCWRSIASAQPHGAGPSPSYEYVVHLDKGGGDRAHGRGYRSEIVIKPQATLSAASSRRGSRPPWGSRQTGLMCPSVCPVPRPLPLRIVRTELCINSPPCSHSTNKPVHVKCLPRSKTRSLSSRAQMALTMSEIIVGPAQRCHRRTRYFCQQQQTSNQWFLVSKCAITRRCFVSH